MFLHGHNDNGWVIAKKCVERYRELANKTTQQLYKVSTPCIDDPPLQRRRNEICWRIVKYMLSNCSEMLKLGKNWTTWYSIVSDIRFARSITKWTKACDKRLNRLISYFHHTCEYKQYCHVGNTSKQCRLGLFHDSDFAGDLEDSKIHFWTNIVRIFGSHTIVPTSWMCQKQTAVSHSSTESEIISLDTGLRLDCLPALELWDLIVSVGIFLMFQIARSNPLKGKTNLIYARHWFCFSNVQSARQEALLYVFEDNEAVMKMISKGRSPTMRHVSGTHRVALDWLFDRIKLDPKNQIKYIDTKNQLADILTKGISHVMSGIICWICLTLAISVLQLAPRQCQNELNKIQEKNESQQNRDLQWILLRGRHRSCRLQLQWARWRDITEIKIHGNKLLEKIDQGNLKGTDRMKASDHHYQKQFMESFSSARYSKWDDYKARSSQEWKADKSMGDRTVQPVVTSWRDTSPNQVSFMRRPSTLLWKRKNLMKERCNPLCTLKEKQGLSNSSLETTKQNQNCHWDPGHSSTGWMIKCGNDNTHRRSILQKTTKNIHSLIWWMFMSVTMESALCSFKCPIRASRSFINVFFRRMKLWSRWLFKAEVLQWDTSLEPTELLLIGWLIELIWTLRSKSNTSTPKTNSLTF